MPTLVTFDPQTGTDSAPIELKTDVLNLSNLTHADIYSSSLIPVAGGNLYRVSLNPEMIAAQVTALTERIASGADVTSARELLAILQDTDSHHSLLLNEKEIKSLGIGENFEAMGDTSTNQGRLFERLDTGSHRVFSIANNFVDLNHALNAEHPVMIALTKSLGTDLASQITGLQLPFSIHALKDNLDPEHRAIKAICQDAAIISHLGEGRTSVSVFSKQKDTGGSELALEELAKKINFGVAKGLTEARGEGEIYRTDFSNLKIHVSVEAGLPELTGLKKAIYQHLKTEAGFESGTELHRKTDAQYLNCQIIAHNVLKRTDENYSLPLIAMLAGRTRELFLELALEKEPKK